MKKALLVIDYTNDFVADNGALTCGKPGQMIENYIVQLTEDFLRKGDLVVFPTDLHEEDDSYHPETKLFPPHNIRGTEGRTLYGKLQDVYAQNSDRVIWMDKTRYSSFAGTPLLQILRARGINELHLVGVCTDICVLHTAVDAYNLGFQLVIHKGGVASFNEGGHDWALGHFANSLGATVI